MAPSHSNAGAAGAGVRTFAALRARDGVVLSAIQSEDAPGSAAEDLRQRSSAVPVVTADGRAAREVLAAVGAPSFVPVWDVLEIASVILPGLEAGGLDALAACFDLERVEDGPAGEARLTVGVFERLAGLLAETDARVLGQASQLAAPLLDWPLRSLFQEVERRRGAGRTGDAAATNAAQETPAVEGRKRPVRRAITPSVHPQPLDVEQVTRAFAADGPLAQAIPGFEAREVQREMTEAVARTLDGEGGGTLLVEAGTGTGKSLAYLVPAAMLSVRNGWRTVVSTATITLQDQLFRKDLPVLRTSVGVGLAACVLKGRANYLCLQRRHLLLSRASGDLSAAERTLLIKTLFWLPRTETGDRAELRLSAAEEEAWQHLAAIAEACTPQRCAYHRQGTCYLARARRTAEASHLVIVSHALLLSDLVSGSRVLPEYQLLVVDEAHHLEDEATSQLSWRVSEGELTARVARLWGEGTTVRGARGLIGEAIRLIREGTPKGGRRAAEVAVEATRLERSVREATQAAKRAFGLIGDLLAGSDAPRDEAGWVLPLTGGVRAGSAWSDVEAAWSDASRGLAGIGPLLAELQGRLAEVPWQASEIEEAATSLAVEAEYWNVTRERLDRAIHLPEAETVYWLSGRRREGTGGQTTWLNAAPLDVAPLLRDGLFGTPLAAVAVSATLTVGGSFGYVKQRLGLQDAETLALGSGFDYRRAALVYVPHDVPEPTQAGYQRVMQEVLFDTITRIGGRTLVLFTSRATLRTTYVALRERMARVGVTLLGQGLDEASRSRLLEQFRQGGRVALFGTSSFWEGVDVVGEALSCVVLARLPFSVPTDPVFAARAEQFDEPFGEYAVPQAVLRFKQGFGRLIRSQTDRGTVVVLDRRLVTRGYGRVFLESLPKCTVQQGPASRTGRVVQEWIAGG